MATIRSRRGVSRGDGNGISRVTRSISLKGARLLQRRPQKKSSCIGVVTIFLALVVLVVVATVQTSLRGAAPYLGSSIRTRNAQHLQNSQPVNHLNDDQYPQQQRKQQQQRRNLQEQVSTEERNDEESNAVTSTGADEEVSMDHIERPRDNSNEDPVAEPVIDEALIEVIEEDLKEEEHEVGEEMSEEQVRKEALEIAKAEEAMEAATPQHEEERSEPERQQEEALVFDEPSKPAIEFCDFMRVRSGTYMTDMPDIGFANPAVLVLGMEDTSTDLTWHVISQILHPDRKSHRTYQLSKHVTAIDYGALSKTEPESHDNFWSNVSEKSHGKWLAHVFCQQESHELATGFPWVLSSPDLITKNEKAKDTLKMIKTLPKGAVKVIRIRRNYLDVLIRHTKLQQQETHDPAVKLDYKKVLINLRRIKTEQEAIDLFLAENEIPYLMLDFETLFPFDHWTDMVQVAQASQGNPLYLHATGRSASSSRVERAWRDVVEFLGVTKPLTLFDILRFAMRTHKVNTFWIQDDSVQQYPRLEILLRGTTFQSTLRHQEVRIQDWGEGDEM